MESVAILYIAIGNYERFWNPFHTSCERYFLPGVPKTYYVFTDSTHIKSHENVVVTPVSDEGWPGNTLHRFRFFLHQDKNLSTHGYCFFFNANACLLKPITAEEVLPEQDQNDLVGLTWRPCVEKGGMQIVDFPYERNPLSTAYIPENEGTAYYQGGFFGGKTAAVRALIRTLNTHVNQDETQHFTAVNNDESHLNRYFLDNQPKCLTAQYGRPEEWGEPSDPSMIFLQKERVLGPWRLYRLKGKSIEYLLKSCGSAFKRNLKQLFRSTSINHS